MPISVELRENGWVIYGNLTDPLSAQDFVDSAKEQTVFYDRADHIVHQIVDASKVHSLPKNVFSLAKSVPAISHPNRGHLVVIGATPVIRSIGEALGRILRFNTIKFCATETEAWAYVHDLIGNNAAASD